MQFGWLEKRFAKAGMTKWLLPQTQSERQPRNTWKNRGGDFGEERSK
jgi:hypothetical protein